MNIAKWVLRNLFIGFIREQQRSRHRNSNMSDNDGLLSPSIGRSPTGAPSGPRTSTDSTRHNGGHSRRASTSPESARKAHRYSGSQIVIHSNKMIPAVIPSISTSPTRSSPLLPPLIPLNTKDGQTGLSIIPQSPVNDDTLAALPSFQRSRSIDGGATPVASGTGGSGGGGGVTTPNATQGDYFSPKIRQSSLQGQSGDEEASAAAASVSTPTPATVNAVSTGSGKPESQGPLSAGGLMGRLRNLGRSSAKRPVSDGATNSPVLGNIVPAAIENSTPDVSVKRFVGVGNTLLILLAVFRLLMPQSKL